MIAKKRDYVGVISVGLPGVVLLQSTCPKFSSTLPDASYFTRLWPGRSSSRSVVPGI